MELSKQEVDALKVYFDETEINVTKFIKKIGLKQWKEIEKVIDKLYKQKDGNL
jgi:hypothetical protein